MSMQSNQEVSLAGERGLMPVGNIKEARADYQRMAPEILRSLPKGMNPDKFMTIALTALRLNPKLLRCTKQSFFTAVLAAATDGLLPDGREGAIVPYGEDEDGRGRADVAKWMPMIAGIRKKVLNSGRLTDWNVQVVQEGDEYSATLGDNPQIHHVPSLKGGRKRPVIAAYSIARFPDGYISREIMNLDQIKDIQSKSKARKGPWNDPIFFPEMCRKTVARLHSKQLPMSTDLEVIFKREDEQFALADVRPATLAPAAPKSVESALDAFADRGIRDDAPQAQVEQNLSASEAADEAMESESSAAEGEAQGSGGKAAHPATSAGGPAPAGSNADIQAAHARGVEWRSKGGAKRALPPEYRDTGHTREALAWTAGFEGAPVPTFTDGEQAK
jgi:recombination protein RecT